MGKNSGMSRGSDKTHHIVTQQDAKAFFDEYIHRHGNEYLEKLSLDFESLGENNELAATFLGKVVVNTDTHTLYVDGVRVNVAKNLRKAIYAIQNGKELSVQQEHALQVLNHELMHNISPWSRGRGATSSQQETMETVTEFLSQMSYHNMISQMGGNAIHGEKMWKYSTYGAEGLREELRAYRVPLNVVADELMKIHTSTSNTRTYKSKVIAKFEELGYKDARKFFNE